MKKQYKNEYGFSTVILIIIGGLLTAIAGTGGYFLSKKFNAPQSVNQQQIKQQEKPAPSAPATDASQKSITEIASLPENQNTADQIIWNDPQEITPGLDIIIGGNGQDTDSAENANFIHAAAKDYKIGKFVNGKYKNGEIILTLIPFEGPCFDNCNDPYYFIRQNNKIIVLGDNPYQIHSSKLIIEQDKHYKLPLLDAPQYIYGLASNQILKFQKKRNEFFSEENTKKAFVHKIMGDVYFGNDNGFHVKDFDGLDIIYTLEIDFVGKDNIPAITWSGNSQNKNEYAYTDIAGCGSSNYVSVITDKIFDNIKIDPFNDFTTSGKNTNGDTIYEFKDKNHPALKYFHDKLYYGDPKMPYEEFLANHPVFFWKDPFDRLIKFQNNKFIPAAECGKPVIYLYPEKPERVSVKVEPVGGMTYSDPSYENGWVVDADTNSNLIEISSGKIYPYLFWEGRGGIYEQPKKGFVIEKENIHNFLIEKLAKLGLNQKETADFMEFWEPRMQGSPYYFVTFLGNQAMDQLAPITINPKPDTIIRILMDFTPLEKPIEVEGYEIKTPKRKGFTVIEWGGVIR